MRKMMMLLMVVVGLLLAGNAFAVSLDIIDPATFAVDTTDVADAGKIIVGGLAGLWGLRKVIKTVNRS